MRYASSILIILLTLIPHALSNNRHLTPSKGLLPWINPPNNPNNCALDILNLGLCLDALGGLVHVGLGDAIQNHCCPVIQGLLELEAAVCLCTAIKLRVLNLDIFIPLSLKVLVTCGKDPPPGWICPLD